MFACWIVGRSTLFADLEFPSAFHCLVCWVSSFGGTFACWIGGLSMVADLEWWKVGDRSKVVDHVAVAGRGRDRLAAVPAWVAVLYERLVVDLLAVAGIR